MSDYPLEPFDDHIKTEDGWTVNEGVAYEPTADDATGGDGEPDWIYPDAGAWFIDYFRWLYMRRVGSRGSHRWSAQWWDRPEGRIRIEALWLAWEHARMEPAGISDWLLHHADPHMAVLMSPEGPFARSKDENDEGEPLPHEPYPEGTFKPLLGAPDGAETIAVGSGDSDADGTDEG